MRTSIDAAANIAGVILGDPRRAVDRYDTLNSSLCRAIQSPPSVGTRTALHEPPTSCNRVLHVEGIAPRAAAKAERGLFLGLEAVSDDPVEAELGNVANRCAEAGEVGDAMADVFEVLVVGLRVALELNARFGAG